MKYIYSSLRSYDIVYCGEELQLHAARESSSHMIMLENCHTIVSKEDDFTCDQQTNNYYYMQCMQARPTIVLSFSNRIQM